ncbi:hypothetical protein VOLCADRAFT_106932 [Volvox carteri f. nagariensis]|uniref:starch synthase n=1 Tax=Volvox carteri f. nagariensis TaxID=3068 RepID=D8UAM8_VOLCA|nr:uncharacterized protein VOLCADRAFT_106932 [Volvox carteri f. nagariensis]EFJ43179.1 hypothetical protein VOLCADRAFT_106932 [Volvox carteri f. nagariensis]|eukprot:XP_002955754.1 hypothetical protein VOLCADRAFT_106932 [Volvox carteri f. nagariensis]
MIDGILKSVSATHVLARPDVQPAVELSISPGDVLATPDAVVQVAISQPTYAVHVLYRSRGGPLEGASCVWAHIGHSGWRDTRDVRLSNIGPDGNSHEEVWQGTYQVPVGRLSAPWHLEVQMVFKGRVGGLGGHPHNHPWPGEGEERWDNNGGSNWVVAVELAPGGEKLVPALDSNSAATRALTSSLLLRLEALVASRLLTPEQGSVLRMLAWQHDLSTVKAFQSVRHLDDKSVAGALAGRCAWLRPPGLNVVHVASELAPIAKVGGLADVVSSLAKAHQMSGLLTEVILPKYDCIQYGDVHELRQMCELAVPWGPEPGRVVKAVVWSGCVEGLPVYFVEPHCPERYFWRGKFYGEPDDAARFCFFSRAALEFLAQRQHEAPDVIHCHDWQAAAVGPLLKETYRASGLSRTRAVLTIHNMAFQGAIVYCDRITTVSPTYAREVLRDEPHLGCGLQAVMRRHTHKLEGVLNGLDYETWNPATDPYISAHYAPDDISGKRTCKAALCKELGLPFDGITTNGNNGNNNGNANANHHHHDTAHNGHDNNGNSSNGHGCWGPNGRPLVAVVQREWEALSREVAAGSDVRVVLRHDDALSHRIFAGADLLLVPSLFEPCGLTQLIALRYGTVPVVRETGGLADTIRDVAHSGAPEPERNGFTFVAPEETAVTTALRRAIAAYRDGREWWATELVPRVMRQDWSWSQSAERYRDIYNTAIGL